MASYIMKVLESVNIGISESFVSCEMNCPNERFTKMNKQFQRSQEQQSPLPPNIPSSMF